MQDIIRRLMFLLHWLGFACLIYWVVIFLTMILPALPEGINELEYAVEDIASIIVIMVDLDESEYPLFWSLWLAVAHYPIRWLLTGNKSLLPWKNN